jgi:hypothetical protein
MTMLKKRGQAGDREPVVSWESFGTTKIARSLGEQILRDTPARRNYLQRIRDRLTSMTLEEKDQLVDRVLSRLALFVFDLPASEKNHHAGRFGLFDHLLEVAQETTRDLASPAFQISPEPSINHRERPIWIYAGMIAAIAHDLGKVLDLSVAAPGGGAVWNPKVEPLRHFCLRLGMTQTGPGIWHHLPGRGTRRHEHHISNVLPLVLIPEVDRFLGPRLASIVAALGVEGDSEKLREISVPASEVVKAVRRADRLSSRDELPEGPPDAGTSQVSPRLAFVRPVNEPGFAPLVLPPPLPRTNFPVLVNEGPLQVLPPDFWRERIPRPRGRRGDPREIERRLAAVLDPASFLEVIRRMTVARKFLRNNNFSDIYIQRDYLWLRHPAALHEVAIEYKLPYDTQVVARMLESLRQSPLVELRDSQRVLVFMRPRGEGRTYEGIRIRRRGFLTDVDLERLGTYPAGVELVEPGFSTRFRG